MTPTKRVMIDDHILRLLRDSDWSDDGLRLVLKGELDRTTYVKVNKAIELLGGKWNRKEKAHIFEKDPRAERDLAIETGMIIKVLDGFFRTPEPVIERMCEIVCPTIFHPILEPSAGDGSIADYLVTKWGVDAERIICVENNQERANILVEKGYPTEEVDFMKFEYDPIFHQCYMNPPFENGQDVQHIMRAWNFLCNGGDLVSVVSESAFYNSLRKYEDFRVWLENVDAFIEKLPPGSFKESGTMVDARLIAASKREARKPSDTMQLGLF